MLEVDQDSWQATLRVPRIVCEADLTVSGPTAPNSLGANHSFVITGNVCGSSIEAKLSCGISFLRYMVSIENKMLEKVSLMIVLI